MSTTETPAPRGGRPPAGSGTRGDRGAAPLAAAVCLSFVVFGTARLAAADSPRDAGHDGHHSHLGLLVGAVNDLKEDSVFPGLGFEFERRLGAGDGRFGIGAAAEMAFDEHKHYVISLLACYHPVGNLTLSVAPGVMFIDRGTFESRAALHFGLGYEFEWGRSCLGPELEIAFAGDDVHLMLGLHLGFEL